MKKMFFGEEKIVLKCDVNQNGEDILIIVFENDGIIPAFGNSMTVLAMNHGSTEEFITITNFDKDDSGNVSDPEFKNFIANFKEDINAIHYLDADKLSFCTNANPEDIEFLKEIYENQ